ncbi:MAG: AAA domain-containing protein [Deltaproteobacteria bacterium]|nr:AAA domain-containing protein [Deltaproteobacteria bacterium]
MESKPPDFSKEQWKFLAVLMEDHVDPIVLIQIMEKAGHLKEACKLEIKLAENTLKKEKNEQAWRYYKNTADRLLKIPDDRDCKTWFLTSIINFSNLSFILGKGMKYLSEYLNKAHEISKSLGDQRTHALINLHLGRLFYFSDRRQDALVALSLGLNEVEELGDKDILDQSAGFLGLFYFMQGLFKEARGHLERAVGIYGEREKGQLTNPLAPVLHGYCLTYLGEFHRAIGSLDCHWRDARQKSDLTMSITLRVILGTVLTLIKKEKEAAYHLKEAVKEAADNNNALAIYLAQGPLALMWMNAGHAKKAHEILSRSFYDGADSGIVRQFASPWILEMIYEFERLGLKPLPGISFDQAMKRAMEENNIHLYGVALRLQARKKISENKSKGTIDKDLEKSHEYLEQSGDIIQLSKTIMEMARLEFSRGNRKRAESLAQKAWRVMGGYADDFFPDDLRILLDHENHENHKKHWLDTPQGSFERFIELTETMFPVQSRDEILSRAVVATNRFFGAERGGLFWFAGGKITKNPELRARCNLTESDMLADNFSHSHALILKSFTKNRIIIERSGLSHEPRGRPLRSILCLPVEVRGKTRAVIYHDNSYLEDCFDFLNDSTMKKIVGHVSRQVGRLWEYHQIKEERNDLIEKYITNEKPDEKVLIYKSRIMSDLLLQLDKASRSDSTILIMGETGVGKELFAGRVHSKSLRRDKAFIVVDATTIPEGLMESELFGHEKGAFTGADRQKKGRLELAHRGTLFIDEIGELPISIQAKLLRAIQEHSFFRVGGTRMHHSDFRLIAATNRELAKEVAAKRFREDLYYRLNVIPFQIPPLRDRPEDIPLLIEHFLNRLGRKYLRQDLYIDAETEALLKQYNWPGNVRELENIIERAVLLSTDDRLQIDLPLVTLKPADHPFVDTPCLDTLEKRYIKYILDKTKGRIGGPGGAADILGLKRSTLYARMKKLKMR